MEEPLSIIVPAYNEEQNIPLLYEAILQAQRAHSLPHITLIIVDDGSTDQTWESICRLPENDAMTIQAIRFRKNEGKSTALQSAFDIAITPFVIMIDADLQDDPNNIPLLLEKLDEGYDMVSGWRKHRSDTFTKRLPSVLYNRVVSLVSGVSLHDHNVGLKAMKNEVVTSIYLSGEQHRFMTVMAHSEGFQVTEVAVTHHKRKFGTSKYGGKRFFEGLLDLMTITLLTRFNGKPSHLFGTLGVIASGIGTLTLLYLLYLWLTGVRPIGDRPLLIFGVTVFLFGIQLITTGLLAELIIHNSNVKRSPSISETLRT